MASPYTPTTVNQGYGAETEINTNNTAIATAISTCLNREDSTDNAMEVDLDMGGYDILNVGSLLLGNLATVAGITASTTQSQGEGVLTGKLNEVSTVANANDTVTLPAASAGNIIIIINNGANTLQIFPASGDNAGGGVDTAITLASGSNITLAAYNATNWETI